MEKICGKETREYSHLNLMSTELRLICDINNLKPTGLQRQPFVRSNPDVNESEFLYGYIRLPDRGPTEEKTARDLQLYIDIFSSVVFPEQRVAYFLSNPIAWNVPHVFHLSPCNSPLLFFSLQGSILELSFGGEVLRASWGLRRHAPPRNSFK